jgi:hypothetical protein
MAPREPKTDGREFELANSAGGQSATPPGGASQDVNTDISIRLCQRDQANPIAPLGWKSESVLVFMIEDLVLASRGRGADESSSVMTARFETSAQALVAAQRIQAAILEFLAYRPGDCLGAAILIHPPLAAPYAFSVNRMQAELRLAQPGQILLSGDVSRLLKKHPGMELREIPGMTVGGREGEGLSELIWVADSPVEQHPSASDGGAHPGEEGPPVGATMIVNAPFGSARAEAHQPLHPTGGTSDHGSLETEFVRDSSSEELLAEFEGRPFLTRPRMLIGATAVLVVGLLVAVLYPHKTKPPMGDRSSQSQSSQTQGSQAGETGAASGAQQAGGNSDISGANSVDATKPAKPTGKHPAKKKESEKQDDVDQSFDGMTRSNIPTLLIFAKRDAGNGDYDKARQEYRAVLRLDSSNAEAKEGLRKLGLAQGQDQ